MRFSSHIAALWLNRLAKRQPGQKVWQTPSGNWRAENQKGNQKSFTGEGAQQKAQDYVKTELEGDKLPKSKERGQEGGEGAEKAPERQKVKTLTKDFVKLMRERDVVDDELWELEGKPKYLWEGTELKSDIESLSQGLHAFTGRGENKSLLYNEKDYPALSQYFGPKAQKVTLGSTWLLSGVQKDLDKVIKLMRSYGDQQEYVPRYKEIADKIEKGLKSRLDKHKADVDALQEKRSKINSDAQDVANDLRDIDNDHWKAAVDEWRAEKEKGQKKEGSFMQSSVIRVASQWLSKEAGFGADRRWFMSKLERNPDGKHFTNYGGVDVESFWLPIAGTPKGEGATFIGKQNSPVEHYTYKDFAQYEKALNEVVTNRKSWLSMKAKIQQERKDYKHDYVVGDILYSSWGYDQTNVNFYQVVDVAGKQVTLREVGSKAVRSEAGAEYVAAVPNNFVGPAMKKMVQQGGAVSIDSSQRAYKWDGKPKYETAWGYGH